MKILWISWNYQATTPWVVMNYNSGTGLVQSIKSTIISFRIIVSGSFCLKGVTTAKKNVFFFHEVFTLFWLKYCIMTEPGKLKLFTAENHKKNWYLVFEKFVRIILRLTALSNLFHDYSWTNSPILDSRFSGEIFVDLQIFKNQKSL